MSEPGRKIKLTFLADTKSLEAGSTRAAAAVSGLSTNTATLSSRLRTAGSRMTSAGAAASRMSVPLALVAGAMVKSAVDFEDVMSQISRLADYDAPVAKWAREIKAEAAGLGQGPQELAEGLYFVASSGAPASEAMNILRVSAKGATVGMGDLSTIADGLTSAINVYGVENLNAARAMDILTAAVQEGKGEASDYSRVIGRVTPVAQNLGIGFEQVAGTLSVLTNRGLSTAEASTGLRQAMVSMLKPTKAGQQVLAGIGLTMDDVRKTVTEKGFLAGLQQLVGAAGDNKEALNKLFPNIRGLNTALILTSEEGLAQTNEIMAAVANSTGKLDKSFKLAEETTKFKFNKAMSQLKTTGIELGAALLPVLSKTLEWVSSMTSGLNNLSPTMKNVVTGFILFGAALGPVLLFLGSIATLVGTITLPVLGVVAAIGALAAGAVALYKTWEPFRDIVNGVGRAIADFSVDTILPAWDRVTEAFPKGLGLIRDAFSDSSTADGMTGFAGMVLRVVGAIGTFVRALPGAVQAVKDWFVENKQTFIDFKDDVVGIFTNIWEHLKPKVMLIVGIVTGLAMFFIDIFNRVKAPIWDAFKRIWSNIVDIFSGVWKIIQGLWDIIAGAFQQDWSQTWNGVKQVFSGIWESLVGIVKVALNGIATAITFALGVITSIWGYAWGGIKTAVSAVWSAIKAEFAKAPDWIVRPIADAVSAAWGWVSGVFGTMVDYVTGLPVRISLGVSGMWNGLKNGLVGVVNWCIDKLNALAGPLNAVLGILPGGMRVPKIPHIHAQDGAIVSSPTLALIGERRNGDPTEVVFPKADPDRGYALLRQAGIPPEGSGGGGRPITNNFTINALDPRDAAAQWEREMTWRMKAAGP